MTKRARFTKGVCADYIFEAASVFILIFLFGACHCKKTETKPVFNQTQEQVSEKISRPSNSALLSSDITSSMQFGSQNTTGPLHKQKHDGRRK